MSTSQTLQPNTDFIISVSSVLNRDTKQFGKKYLTDGNEETCWHSDEGEYQWIYCQFATPVLLSRLSIQFQGGFSAKKIVLQFYENPQTLISEETLYPQDNNLMQNFTDINNTNHAKIIKILLLDCSDMFGRVIVYNLQLFTSSQ